MTTQDDKHLSIVSDDDGDYPVMSGGDFYLRWLLALVNLEPELRVRLTLDLGHGVYEGTLVSRRVYATRMRDQVTGSALHARLQGVLAVPFDTMLGYEKPSWPADSEELREEIDRASYVHLVDYHVVQGGQVGEEVPDTVWRGSVEDVVGWTLLSLAQEVPD